MLHWSKEKADEGFLCPHQLALLVVINDMAFTKDYH
jgi:hypothetical protein